MTLLSVLSHGLLISTILITTTILVPLTPWGSRWYQLVIVQSASMEPWLPVGSMAFYKLAKNYEVGDVIAYQYDDGTDAKTVLHRIIEKRHENDSEIYLTKGDANSLEQSLAIYAGQVKGKVVGSVPSLGYAVSWLQTPSGVALVIFIPLALLVIYYLTRLP